GRAGIAGECRGDRRRVAKYRLSGFFVILLWLVRLESAVYLGQPFAVGWANRLLYETGPLKTIRLFSCLLHLEEHNDARDSAGSARCRQRYPGPFYHRKIRYPANFHRRHAARSRQGWESAGPEGEGRDGKRWSGVR